MALKSHHVLKKGLDKFSKKFNCRKEEFLLKIFSKESISEADEQQLDHEDEPRTCSA